MIHRDDLAIVRASASSPVAEPNVLQAIP